MEKLSEKLYCQNCERETNHGVILQHDEKGSNDDIIWSTSYYITQCLGCDEIAFAQKHGDSEQWDYNEQGEQLWYDTWSVYPEKPRLKVKLLDRVEKKEFYSVPEFIIDLYKQVVGAYNERFLLLCAIGLRSIVEAICVDVGVVDGYIFDEDNNIKMDKTGNQKRSYKLNGKINGLIEKELIAKRQAVILHDVRELGNYAVHEIKTPKQRVLKDAIEIVERILHSIYELDNYEISPKKPEN